MKTILCTIAAFCLLAPAHAQYASSASGSTTAAAEINSKPSLQIVAGAPTSLACTAGKDLAYNSVAQTWHVCIVTGTPGTWAQVDAAMTFNTGLLRTGNAVTCLTGSGSQLGCISAADWNTFNGKVTNPLTTAGDIFIGGASGVPARLAGGALNTVLQGGGAGVSPLFVALPSGGTNGCSGTADKPLYNSSTHTWSCGTDQTGGAGTANQICTFSSGASTCTITYTTALTDGASASEPSCVYTDVTPYVGFQVGLIEKATTSVTIHFSPTPTRAGKCSINTSGGSGGGSGTPGGVDGQIQINSTGTFAGRTIGPGLVDDGTALKLDTLVVRTFLSGSASLTHGVITAGNCASQDITITGASLGDRLIVGPPAELLSFTLFPQYSVISANTVRIRLCNPTGSSITPTAAITWNVDVVKAF